jgi:kynurenine formamidase
MGPERRLDEHDVLSYLEELSNWGRWGVDDGLGTLNHITPALTAQAARLIESGSSVGCGRPIGSDRYSAAGGKYVHFMTASGDAAPDDDASTAGDWFGIGCHGFEFTHLDAHSHFFWKGRMYNDRPSTECSTERGALSGGIEPWFSGVSGRGILIDGPELRDKPWLEPSEALFPEELDRWFEEKHINPRPGDVVFVRTGRDKWEKEGIADVGTLNSPGLDGSCLPWLAEHEVAVISGDGSNDALPSGVPSLGRFGPIHLVGLVQMGLWLIDNAELGPLAEECQRQGRFEFFVSISPPPLRRVTGAPVNPVAIF